MSSTCPNCKSLVDLGDEELPEKGAAYLACPECRQLFRVSRCDVMAEAQAASPVSVPDHQASPTEMEDHRQEEALALLDA